MPRVKYPELLSQILYDKFNIDSKIRLDKRGIDKQKNHQPHYHISIERKRSYFKFFEAIGDCPSGINSLSYKWKL